MSTIQLPQTLASASYRRIWTSATWNFGLVRARQHRSTEAIAVISEAIALSRSQSSRLMEGRLLGDLSIVLDDSGDAQTAAASRGKALAIFDRLGAKLYASHLRSPDTFPGPVERDSRS